MGFFRNFSTIGKIYDKLKDIERDLTEMQKCLYFPYLRSGFNQASVQSLKHFKELLTLVENSDDSVQRADFEFAGQKKPIAHHLFAISEYMKQMNTEYRIHF